MSTGKSGFKLEKSKDWDAWIAVIKGKAVGHQIWDKIDPTQAIKPQQVQKPQEIEEPDEDAIENDPNAYTKYKLQLTTYKTKLARWKEQHESLSKIVDLIYDTVGVANLTYIQKVEVHPWDLLRALKARLAPSDSARSLELRQTYERLKKGPSSKQNIETWLDDYVQMYFLAKEHGIAEITNTQRAYRDFLMAIEDEAPVLAQMHEYLTDTAADEEKLLFDVIEKFRNRIRLREVKKVTKNTASNSAIASASSENRSQSRTLIFRGKSSRPKSCLCGQTHWWSDCYYLNEKTRPSGWTPNKEVQKRIEQKMTAEPEFKVKIEKAIARNDQLKKNTSSKDSKDIKDQPDTMGASHVSRAASKASFKASKDANLHGAFPIAKKGGYPLRSSWILNHGSDIHVANDTMQHRFIKERDCTDGSTIAAGRELLAVAAYGKIVVNIQTPTGSGTITLLNVAYISDFMVNIVSGSILDEKGLHFDTQHRHLHRNGQTVAFAPKVGNHYVIEDNTKSTANVFIAKAGPAANPEPLVGSISFLLMQAPRSLNTSQKLLKG